MRTTAKPIKEHFTTDVFGSNDFDPLAELQKLRDEWEAELKNEDFPHKKFIVEETPLFSENETLTKFADSLRFDKGHIPNSLDENIAVTMEEPKIVQAVLPTVSPTEMAKPNPRVYMELVCWTLVALGLTGVIFGGLFYIRAVMALPSVPWTSGTPFAMFGSTFCILGLSLQIGRLTQILKEMGYPSGNQT